MSAKDFRNTFKLQAESFMENFGKNQDHKDDEHFIKYCLDMKAEILGRQSQLDLMFAHFDDVGMGVTFANDKNDRFAFILPDASCPGKFRYQDFAAFGWLSHFTCETLDEVIYEAFNAGYRTPAAADTLDRLSATLVWARGQERCAIIQLLNTGKLSSAEAYRLSDELDAKYVALEANAA